MSADGPLRTPITDRMVGAICLVGGLVVLWEIRGLEYWSEFGPGPQFLPFWVAIGMIASASVLVIKNAEHARLDRSTALSVAIYLGLILVSVFSFARLGAVLTFASFVALELRLVERYKLVRALLIAIAVAGSVTLVFVVGLKVSLPRIGIFNVI